MSFRCGSVNRKRSDEQNGKSTFAYGSVSISKIRGNQCSSVSTVKSGLCTLGLFMPGYE